MDRFLNDMISKHISLFKIIKIDTNKLIKNIEKGALFKLFFFLIYREAAMQQVLVNWRKLVFANPPNSQTFNKKDNYVGVPKIL